ncbi:MAG: sigma-54-dependent Fis family transcriptional regulator [Planctomycetes bacterium]|nr:sigma-54-dependent Fis family transcriptional regulator [Planctomycetota bacterium]
MERCGRVLVVDDERSLLEVLEIVLERSGYDVVTRDRPEDGLVAFRETRPDIVLLDLVMPSISGLQLLEQFKKIDPTIPVIVITAHSSWDNALEAMRLGAFDFIKKPFASNDQIREVVSRALAQRAAPDTQRASPSASEILGNSPAIREALGLVERAAPTDTTVLITGESGTGKELLSRAVHYRSPRAGGPFLSVNCAAFPETLLESELFGHKRGAFSGASSDKQGLIEVCHKGTFFLDEVGELSLSTQVKLLRVLEQRTLLRVGDTSERTIDVRFICATNRNLEDMVANGSFRADLYYRINVLPIHLPPLRERKKDIPLLAAHFLARCSQRQGKPGLRLGTAVQEQLMAYDWPGNVRELHNVVQRAVTLAQGDTLRGEHLLLSTRRRVPHADLLPATGIDLEQALAETERRYLVAALDRTGGHVTNAAKLLGISFRAMRYKIQKHDLVRE